jgi:hypothetical protein
MRTISAFCATAGLFLFVTAAAAQSPATTTDDRKWDSKEMTITGCVEKTKSGGYFLREMRESSAPATTTGTSGSAATTTADAKEHHGGMMWNLGQSDRIERYVGQRVEVIGHPDKGTSGDKLKGSSSNHEIEARDFDVKSVKSLGSSCR